MNIRNKAFSTSIEDGYARILLTLEPVECEVENNAPDFISVEKDEPNLIIDLNESYNRIAELSYPLSLSFHRHIEKEERVLLKPDFECVWFDIPMDDVKDLWVSDLNFIVESEHPRYIAYYIRNLNHHFEWLQNDIASGEIKTMSLTKKKFKAPLVSGKERFTATEVIRCADMISRAIRKVDLRVGGAYVRFNTDKGRLEPLIVGMADKLGYTVERLPKDQIDLMNDNGSNVSHSFFLKRSH